MYKSFISLLPVSLKQNLVNIFQHFISDVDECQMSTHNCSDNATCINTEGSFNCSCKTGYRGNGYNCTVGAFKTLLIFFTFLRIFLLKKKITNKQTNNNNLQQKHFHRSAVLSQSRAKVSAGFTNVGSLQSQHLILYTAPCLYSGLFLSPTIISNLVMK